MNARSLIVTLALGLLATPLAAEAQLASKVHRIGHLGLTNAVAARPGIDALRQALRERGWVDGQNLVIEFRWAEGQRDRMPALAAELVGLRVDLIVASSDPAAIAVKNATTTIPVVMVGVGDPVRLGLVQSLARPGGNLTGITWDPTPDIIGKQLELLKETVPAASRVAVLLQPSVLRGPYSEAASTAARALGVALQNVEVSRADELDAAFAAMTRHRADALLVMATAVTYTERARVAALAVQHRLPTMFDMHELVAAGGLMAYAATTPHRVQRAAYLVDRILRGARPADLPVEQPTLFELTINLKTARALGLTIPESVLFRANEVIR